MTYLITGIITGLVIGYLVAHLRSVSSVKRLEHELDGVGSLKKELSDERSKKDELIGKNKEQYANFEKVKAEHAALLSGNQELHKKVTHYEASELRAKKDQEQAIDQLDAAKKSLEQERERVTKEDQDRQKKALEERDRMWGEHEQEIQSQLADLCKKPESSFTFYSNDNLPEEFDGSLKPDFMIEFLGQYIIFDAKVTRSQDIKIYIKDQVKKTARKAKGRSDIYPSIFLVIPTDAISELKELVYLEEGFTFYVVSQEALAPILSSLKKITSYELAEQFDPQERENIVSLIAELDYHISERNTFDILMAGKGAEVIKNAQKIHPELMEEAERKKGKMRLPSFKKAEIKKLLNDVSAREEAASELTTPIAAVEV